MASLKERFSPRNLRKPILALIGIGILAIAGIIVLSFLMIAGVIIIALVVLMLLINIVRVSGDNTGPRTIRFALPRISLLMLIIIAALIVLLIRHLL